MKEKRLLAILGSPHMDGTSAAMLHCAMTAASTAGWHVDTIRLYEQRLSYCTGCLACVKTGACVQKDDLQHIAALLQSCDVVALAAPTYWANVPAVVKNLFDRFFGTVMEETNTFPRPRLSKKQRYLLLTSCNTPFPFSRIFGQSSHCLRAMDEFFRYAGMKSLGNVCFDGAKGNSNLPILVSNQIRRYWK